MSAKEFSRYEVITNLIQKIINGTEAAKQLCLSVRQVKRLKASVKKHGAQSLIHGNRGKQSNRKTKDDVVNKVKAYIKKQYHDFGPTLAQEKLEERHNIKLGVETIRQIMIEAKLWKPKQRKTNKEYRAWRPRKEYYGEMEQFDGCYHKWFEDRAPECCLLVAIDDAAGTITKARFGFNESVRSVFCFWKEYVEKVGKPLSIYLDKYSTYKINHPSAVDNTTLLTQFQRATKQLGIGLITAHSPEAKGRIERLFETLQDRLVKELRLAGISTIEEANRFLEEVFIEKFNVKFGVMPQKKRNLHQRLTEQDRNNLDHIFSVHSVRRISNDFTIRFKNQYIQLKEKQPVLVLRTNKVLIEERLNDTLHISLRNRYLNFSILPERPEKIKTKVIALTKMPSAWKPPANHPWRRFILPGSVPQRYQRSPQTSNVS